MGKLMGLANKIRLKFRGGVFCKLSSLIIPSHIISSDKDENYNILNINNSAISKDLAISRSASEDFQDVSCNIQPITQQQDNNHPPNIYGGGALSKSLAACMKNKRENGYLYILNQRSFWFLSYTATRQYLGGTVLQYAFEDICEGRCG